MEKSTAAAAGVEGVGSYMERATAVGMAKEIADWASGAVTVVEGMAEVVSVVEAMEYEYVSEVATRAEDIDVSVGESCCSTL